MQKKLIGGKTWTVSLLNLFLHKDKIILLFERWYWRYFSSTTWYERQVKISPITWNSAIFNQNWYKKIIYRYAREICCGPYDNLNNSFWPIFNWRAIFLMKIQNFFKPKINLIVIHVNANFHEFQLIFLMFTI